MVVAHIPIRRFFEDAGYFHKKYFTDVLSFIPYNSKLKFTRGLKGVRSRRSVAFWSSNRLQMGTDGHDIYTGRSNQSAGRIVQGSKK